MRFALGWLCMFCLFSVALLFFFKQKTAYEMRISDWSSDVCSSDLRRVVRHVLRLERPDREAAPREGAAESGRQQRLADVGSGALQHDGRCPGQGSSPRLKTLFPSAREIGRASWRERVCPYV